MEEWSNGFKRNDHHSSNPFLRGSTESRLTNYLLHDLWYGDALRSLAAYFPALLESACSIFRASNQHRSDKRLR